MLDFVFKKLEAFIQNLLVVKNHLRYLLNFKPLRIHLGRPGVQLKFFDIDQCVISDSDDSPFWKTMQVAEGFELLQINVVEGGLSSQDPTGRFVDAFIVTNPASGQRPLANGWTNAVPYQEYVEFCFLKAKNHTVNRKRVDNVVREVQNSSFFNTKVWRKLRFLKLSSMIGLQYLDASIGIVLDFADFDAAQMGNAFGENGVVVK